MTKVLLFNSKPLLYNNKLVVQPRNFPTVTNLKAWYSARLTPAIVDNTAVSAWTDFSGNSTAIAQATGAAQPKYRTNVINGMPAYQFDGTDDTMIFTLETLTQNKTGLSTYVVFKRSAGTAIQTVYQFSNSVAGARHSLGMTAATPNIFVGARRVTESLATAIVPTADTQFHVAANITNYAADLLSFWLDNKLMTASLIGGTAGANSQNSSPPDTSDFIGGVGGSFFNGYVAEFLFADVAHTPAETQDIMAALRLIYGGLPQ